MWSGERLTFPTATRRTDIKNQCKIVGGAANSQSESAPIAFNAVFAVVKPITLDTFKTSEGGQLLVQIIKSSKKSFILIFSCNCNTYYF